MAVSRPLGSNLVDTLSSRIWTADGKETLSDFPSPRPFPLRVERAFEFQLTVAQAFHSEPMLPFN